ncbi:MAG: hypothetical protein JWP44_2299 [Mucilaginibacter sp.]|nr:hypothetical protein [Mucilaginibacter sp.]
METCESNKILAKLVYLLKRSIDEWIENGLCCASQLNFNKSHLPFFMSIGTTGISNTELAANLSVTKQAASKIVKELEAINLVRSEKNEVDARSSTLYLTDEGIRLYNHISSQICLLEEDYKKMVGAKNYETAINVMVKLTAYHEKRSKVALN